MKTEALAGARVVLVGAGNVGASLAAPLGRRLNLVAWANRTVENLEGCMPSAKCRAVALGDVKWLRPHIVIVAAADSAVDSVVQAIGPLEGNPLCLLTSGTVSMDALRPMSPRVGVLYPLQTFTSGFDVDVAQVPFFTESALPEDLELVDGIAESLGARAYHADQEHRRVLHIAGVISNNFVNILLERTQDILAGAGFELETVHPLVEMTVRKAFAIGPHAAQTGPALRRDYRVMEQQLSEVPDDLKQIFEQLNNLIIKAHEQD